MVKLHEYYNGPYELFFTKYLVGNGVANFKQSTALAEKFIGNLLSLGEAPFTAYNLFEGLEQEFEDALISDIGVLTFSVVNSKLGGSAITFSLPAGWTCPFAKLCKQQVERHRKLDPSKIGTFHTSRKTGMQVPYKGEPPEVHDGEDMEFKCYAAAQERQYDALRENRWHNYDLLDEVGREGGASAQSELIVRSLQHHFDTKGMSSIVRIHESGDFYNGEYLNAWILTAKEMPNINFYAYTKSLPLINKFKSEIDSLPNLSITLSEGGSRDRDLDKIDIKQAKVFNTPEEVFDAGLIIDLDDELAQEKGGKDKNFALLVHGTQEAGEMTQYKLRNETFMAYWKYRGTLNKFFKRSPDNYWSSNEAVAGINVIDKFLNNSQLRKKNKMSVGDLKFKKKLLNYVIKYDRYGFDPKLINTVPDKYR